MLALYLASLGFGSTLIFVSLFFGGGDKDFDKDVDLDKDFDLDKDLDLDKDFDLDHDVDVDVDVDVDADGDLDLDGEVDLDTDLDGEIDADAEVEVEADHDHAFDKDFDQVAEGVAEGSDALWIPFLSMRFWTFALASFGLAGTLLTLLGVPALVAGLVAVSIAMALGIGAAWFFRQLKKDTVSGETRYNRFVGEEARVMLRVRPGERGKIAIETLAGRVEMLATTRDRKAIERGSTVIVASVRDGVADVSRLPTLADGEARRRERAKAQQQARSGRTKV